MKASPSDSSLDEALTVIMLKEEVVNKRRVNKTILIPFSALLII